MRSREEIDSELSEPTTNSGLATGNHLLHMIEVLLDIRELLASPKQHDQS
jgi:hypothetical protein